MVEEYLSGLAKDKWRVGLIDKDRITPKYISIIGPTASGKSKLALQLAKKFNGEIVNCDSVQLYKGFNIGSAKPNLLEQNQVKHHLIDCLEWNEPFDAAKFSLLAQNKIRGIFSRGKLPIVVGGSGLYLRSLWSQKFHTLPSDKKLRQELNARDFQSIYDELKIKDPKRAADLHPKDKFRTVRALEINILTGKSVAENLTNEKELPEFPPCFVIMMQPDREVLRKKIQLRIIEMLEEGFVSEVKGLLNQGCSKDAKPMQSIGYKQVVAYLDGEIEESDLASKIAYATAQYAKRQYLWYKKINADIYLKDPKESDVVMAPLKQKIQQGT